MRLINEDQILDLGFRKMVIDEIEGNENKKRKAEAMKRYDIFKDKTKQYVLEAMESESSDKKVVDEIMNRAANISFCRKIINKKAMVYKDGVTRISDNAQEQIDEIIDYLNFNTVMKKINKYAELFRNSTVEVMPYKDPITEKYYYNGRVLAPYLYDVIEDDRNPEKARVYIKSYFNNSSTGAYVDENREGYREGNTVMGLKGGDGKDQIIADNPKDKGANQKNYIWWSNKYHFTTDEKGNIISEDIENPIQMLPFYNFSQEQDGQFWSVGGDDIIDASVLINVLLTDLFYIAKYQGMGIGYLFGKGVPKNMKVGASSFISIDVKDGDPTPSIGFASSNPPINAHLDMIEKYVAFILSTNNLEPGTVQGQLSAAGAASGVQEMIRKSENIDDLINQREIYRDGEPHVFKIIVKWHNLYQERDLLVPELQELGKIPEDFTLNVKFPDAQPFMTETEKLDIIEKRKKLGLDSDVDSIRRDNPDLTEEEALEKARQQKETKLKANSERLKLFAAMNKEEDEEEGDQDGK